MLTTSKITLLRAKTGILSVNIEPKLHLQEVNTDTKEIKISEQRSECSVAFLVTVPQAAI